MTVALPVYRVKNAVRARDRHHCTVCGMTDADHRQRYERRLAVHRKTPGSSYALDDSCVTVCIPCHAEAHRAIRGTKRTRLVRIPADVAAMAKQIAAVFGHKPIDFISELLRVELQALLPEGIRRLEALSLAGPPSEVKG